ncbi:MAG: hypothetical protein OEO83_04905 [Alphaproteobacteria bacterium]|nr:hypothetical protein [Alphaproteobacteria bacterium]
MDEDANIAVIPQGWEAQAVTPVGYSDLAGRPGAFKIAVTEKDGRWYLYLGHLWHYGWSVVDVTDPANPRYVKFIDGPPNTWTIQVTLHGDLMLTALQRQAPSWGGDADRRFEEGVMLWDISDPEDPKFLSHWRTGALGTHRNIYPGGDFAFLSAVMPGFDRPILVTLDVSDPRHPKEAGRFWLEGQKEGETKPADKPLGFHGPLNLGADGKTAYLGYAPAVLILDMGDVARPDIIGRLDMAPPFGDGHSGPQALHTVLPLAGEDKLLVSSEAHAEGCDEEVMQYVGIVDIREKSRPRLTSLFPEPAPPAGAAYAHFCEKGGRFGPHNTNQEQHNPFVQRQGSVVYYTWFNAGLRIFDIDDPRRPRECAWFVPPAPQTRVGPKPEKSLTTQTEDVAVDARGNIYISDKQWGLFILRYDGPNELKT